MILSSPLQFGQYSRSIPNTRLRSRALEGRHKAAGHHYPLVAGTGPSFPAPAAAPQDLRTESQPVIPRAFRSLHRPMLLIHPAPRAAVAPCAVADA